MKNCALSLFAFLISATFSLSANAATPWEALSADEIERAASAVKAEHGEDTLFLDVTLARPDKDAALTWQRGDRFDRAAAVTFISDGTAYDGLVDLASRTLSANPIPADRQPILSGDEEFFAVVQAAPAHPDFAAALSTRGVDPENAFCVPRTIGNFNDVADATKRLAKVDCFLVAGAKRNVFARPIEGLIGLYDFGAQDFVEVVDLYEGTTPPPIPPGTEDFDEGTVPPRDKLNAVELRQRGNGNVVRYDSQVVWQNWRFHFRFDRRQGTILNNIQYKDGDELRSVAYELAMSEMFVPYQDPTTGWYYRNYFDMGEYGFGSSSTPLKGADCPDYAAVMDAVVPLANGAASIADRRMCLFEQTPGHPIWRHSEPILDALTGEGHESRPATELVLRMVSTIGNYDYFQDYIFTQDGRLNVRLISTGIDAVKSVATKHMSDVTAAEDTAFGTLIGANRVAINHDHFFNYRIDLDVDGKNNSFERLKLKAVNAPKDSPKKSYWIVDPQKVTSERGARTRINPDRPAALLIRHTDKVNKWGNPTGYQIISNAVARPLVDPMDPASQRGAFTHHDLWVTAYRQDELFASGKHVNQAPGGQGLPKFVEDNQNIENTDIVAWLTIGFHHVPMAEDWPVMPAKVDGFTLKPRNFFDRNPALDVPSEMKR